MSYQDEMDEYRALKNGGEMDTSFGCEYYGVNLTLQEWKDMMRKRPIQKRNDLEENDE